LQPYVVDVDHISSLQHVPKNELCIPIPPESDHSCNLEEILSHTCVVEVDPLSLPQPIYKYEVCIQIPLEPDHPCNIEEIEIVSKPSEISSPSNITIEPCYQLATSHT